MRLKLFKRPCCSNAEAVQRGLLINSEAVQKGLFSNIEVQKGSQSNIILHFLCVEHTCVL